MTSPLLIEEENISEAWLRVLEEIINHRGKEISPLLLTLTKFDESSIIHEALDMSLLSNNLATIQTVSETIFPYSLYLYCEKNREELYREYNNNLLRIKKLDSSNRNGTYFERLISYEGKNRKINQLEIIISSLEDRNIKRRSKLQAAIFNPEKDHTNLPYQNFPCLQHVTFFKSEDNGLILNSFYAIQYLYRRAYGNWLGLINLGKFIANELDIKFERLNCYVGVEVLDQLTKKEAKSLFDNIRNRQG